MRLLFISSLVFIYSKINKGITPTESESGVIWLKDDLEEISREKLLNSFLKYDENFEVQL